MNIIIRKIELDKDVDWFIYMINQEILKLLSEEEKEKIRLFVQIKVISLKVNPAYAVNFKELQERGKKLEEEIKQIIKRLEIRKSG